MANPVDLPQNFSTTLNVAGGINSSQTTGIVLTSVSGLPTTGGFLCLDWAASLDTSVAEYIEYTGISGNELTGVVREAEGSSGKAHSNGCTVVGIISKSNINRLNDKIRGTDAVALQDVHGNEVLKTAHVDSAVNEITLANAATNTNPTITASGETNVGLDVKMKGTGVLRKPTVVGIQVFDSAVSTATGDGKAFFRVPAELNGMNLTGVAMSVYTAGTTNTTDVQLRNKTDSVDMLSTKLTIDSTETDTSTAATPAVIDTTKDDVVTGDVIAIDVDAINTTAAKGLYIEMRFELP
jgi:hypothetical protein